MIIIIMAGGLGKRMESDLPKVLHEVSVVNQPEKKYPMLIHVLMTALKLNPEKIFIIVGKFKNIIKESIDNFIKIGLLNINIQIEYVDQPIALGTGDAIKCVLPYLNQYNNSTSLILSGDVPLISTKTLENLCGITNKILITELDEPFGCGRIIWDRNSNIVDIVEEKDCTDLQKKIKFVNCGIYQIAVKDLINLIPLINNNNKSQEYYLTDIIKLMIINNIFVDNYTLEKNDQYQIKNVNTKKDLEELNNFIENM